jgi:hypothetical protein
MNDGADEVLELMTFADKYTNAALFVIRAQLNGEGKDAAKDDMYAARIALYVAIKTALAKARGAA